jgi:hypothetical protein
MQELVLFGRGCGLGLAPTVGFLTRNERAASERMSKRDM